MNESVEAWRASITDLKRLLVVLDTSNAPLEVGAHIDFAACRLEEALSELLNGGASVTAGALNRGEAIDP